MIELRNVSFSYAADQPPVLEGLDLSIPAGQWLAIIGMNGSGKSTLARCLNGLLLPNEGAVEVDGLLTTDEESLMQIRQQVAFVFQNPDNQLVATSVEDDIAFGPENLGLPREEITRRVDAALAMTGLTEQREKAPHLLSGGEKQRVALAGALAMSASYLVLDEPTSMLDPLMRAQVIQTLQKLHQERGAAIIFVTNIMEEALLAERIVVLNQGRIVQDGTPKEIFADPAALQELELDVPQVCRLAALLAEAGFEQFRGLLAEQDLMEKLCE